MTDSTCCTGFTLPEKAGRWRAWNLVWLIYSVFFVIEPVQSGSVRQGASNRVDAARLARAKKMAGTRSVATGWVEIRGDSRADPRAHFIRDRRLLEQTE